MQLKVYFKLPLMQVTKRCQPNRHSGRWNNFSKSLRQIFHLNETITISYGLYTRRQDALSFRATSGGENRIFLSPMVFSQ